jgi:cytochrome oxidase Cu insertion factor (SCO1/SenC/PrrC family)
MSVERICKLIAIIIVMIMCFPIAGACGSERPEYKRTVHGYVVPYVTLTNQDGQKVNLKSFLKQRDKVIIMDFIFGAS